MLRFPKVNPRSRRAPADYADQLIDEMNERLRHRKIKIDGSVSRDVYDGVVADVSTFVIDASGAPVMSRNGFAMLVHVGEDPRAEIFKSYANDVDTVVPLTGYDAAFDADRIVNQSEHLLKDIRKVDVKAARRNPNVPKAGDTFSATSYYISISDMGQSNSQLQVDFVMLEDGSAKLKGTQGYEVRLPAERVAELFQRGKTQGLGFNTVLSDVYVNKR